jgi:hypothetical protein
MVTKYTQTNHVLGAKNNIKHFFEAKNEQKEINTPNCMVKGKNLGIDTFFK